MDRESDRQRVWSLLSNAGLIDIPAEQFPERIKEAKNAVMERLSELLEKTIDMQERDSAAYSLATLKKLESTLQRNAKRGISE
jgi:hypothetical protein